MVHWSLIHRSFWCFRWLRCGRVVVAKGVGWSREGRVVVAVVRCLLPTMLSKVATVAIVLPNAARVRKKYGHGV